MTPADKSDAERIAALEAEVKVLREWLASYTQTRPIDWIPTAQPFTPSPWPHSPFTWGTDGTGLQPPECPQPTVRSAT